jgi:hypothetical protein
MTMPRLSGLLLTCLFATAACGDDAPTVLFDLDGASTPQTFWDFPFPSDLRLTASGAPDLAAFPNPRRVPILDSLLSIVPDRRGFPVMPTAYFRFTAPIGTFHIVDLVPDGVAYLVDIDPASPERGTTYPLVAQSLPRDGYTTSDVLALAPRPGIVLRASTRYAFVLARALAPGFERPAGLREDDPFYRSMWDTLSMIGLARGDVLAATAFTTGDEVAGVRGPSEETLAPQMPVSESVELVGDDTYDGFCRLAATITVPQFQTGTQPFDQGGVFEVDAGDVPVAQGQQTIPLALTLPKRAMPASGWPLYQFFHGSGGVSTGLVDLGYSASPTSEPEAGKGPGYVVARHGIAAAAAALPVNPERLASATDYAYLNINNLAAFPSTFQQGVFEQRLLLDALLALRIPDGVLAGCTGISSPGGEHFFDGEQLMAGGQSMGGMYTNMIAAVEERYGALVPTGAGGFWNLMILEATVIPGARALLGTALGVDDETLAFVHPAMNVMALAWEIAEPLASMARLARRPLPGLPARHIYEPVGKDDEYFPISIFDAAALAYGNQQAGPAVWPSLQEALALDGLGGLASYPVSANQGGKTRVVVQFEGDGIVDSHYIYRQLETVKHQYGCFLASYVRDGVPTVPAPGALDAPCP